MKSFDALGYETQLEYLTQLAKITLDRYGLSGPRVTLLGDCENTVFQVEVLDQVNPFSDGSLDGYKENWFILRVHRPRYHTTVIESDGSLSLRYSCAAGVWRES